MEKVGLQSPRPYSGGWFSARSNQYGGNTAGRGRELRECDRGHNRGVARWNHNKEIQNRKYVYTGNRSYNYHRSNSHGTHQSRSRRYRSGQYHRDRYTSRDISRHTRYTPKSYTSCNNIDNASEGTHFEWTMNQRLCDGRYIIKGLLGEGTFGRVFRCLDLDQQHMEVAVKVVKAVERYTSASKSEASILKHLKYFPDHKHSNCLNLYDVFYEGNHICLVTNILSLSLYEFLKKNKYKGLFVADIQKLAHNISIALNFLHSPANCLAHTDLKLENILLVDDRSYETLICRQFPASDGPNDPTMYRPYNVSCQVIDFGCAIYRKHFHSSLINTRQYRSPEVILGLPWNEKSDIWSFGCILVELYTGTLLFDTHNHAEHILMIQKLFGIPQWMLRECYLHDSVTEESEIPDTYIKRLNVRKQFLCPDSDRNEVYRDNRSSYDQRNYRLTRNFGPRELHDLMRNDDTPDYTYYIDEYTVTQKIRHNVATKCPALDDVIQPIHSQFNTFVRYILNPDPRLRPSADEILSSSFFSCNMQERDIETLRFLQKQL